MVQLLSCAVVGVEELRPQMTCSSSRAHPHSLRSWRRGVTRQNGRGRGLAVRGCFGAVESGRGEERNCLGQMWEDVGKRSRGAGGKKMGDGGRGWGVGAGELAAACVCVDGLGYQSDERRRDKVCTVSRATCMHSVCATGA